MNGSNTVANNLSRRNLSMDVAAFVFSFCVFLNHSNRFIAQNEKVRIYMMFGYLGAEFFFILSGCLMASRAEGERKSRVLPTASRFVYSRIGAFYPYFFAAWIMGMVVDSAGKTGKAVAVNVLKSVPVLLQINMAGVNGYQVINTAWLFSAMILTMLVVYPLLLRFGRTFNLVIAPAVCIFCYGYLFRKVGHLATINPLDGGVIYSGVIRSFAGISLGCVCFECAKAFSRLPLNRRGGIAIGVVELLAFGLAVFSTKTRSNFRPDFIFICFAALGITAGFCRQNALFVNAKAGCSWIGRFALCFYLADPIARTVVLRNMPDATRGERLTGAIWRTLLFAAIIQLSGFLLKELAGMIGTCLKQRKSIQSNNSERKGLGLLAKLKHHQFLFEELVKRDFKKKYKRTVLGMAWSIMSPLLTLLIMRMVFTNFFGRNMEHYTTYLFCGTLVFTFFSESTNQGMSALMSNAGIFTKVNVPKYLFLLSKNVQCLINFGLTILVFFLFCFLDHITFTWRIILLVYPICALVLFNIGVGMILSALFVFFRDTEYLWQVFTRLLMYMSAVFYTVDSFSPEAQRNFLANPVYLFISYFRQIVIDMTVPTPGFHLLIAADTLLALGIGAWVYKKYNHQFLYYV